MAHFLPAAQKYPGDEHSMHNYIGKFIKNISREKIYKSRMKKS